MAKRERGPKFSLAEKETLIELVRNNIKVIENKKTDAVTTSQKESAWTEVEKSFNATSTVHRPAKTLKKFWANLKTAVRHDTAAEKLDIFSTGGGTSKYKRDPVLEAVKFLIASSSVEGLHNPYDDDAEYLNNTVMPVVASTSAEKNNDENDGSMSVEIISDWSHWNPEMLKQATSEPLRLVPSPAVIQEEPSTMPTPSAASFCRDEEEQQQQQQQEQQQSSPPPAPAVPQKITWTQRRRPVLKKNLDDKCDSLVKARMELVVLNKKFAQEEHDWRKKEHEWKHEENERKKEEHKWKKEEYEQKRAMHELLMLEQKLKNKLLERKLEGDDY